MWQPQTDDEHGLPTPDTADLGLGVGNEDGREFDTPTLVETWRTAPYLYDGRALTVLGGLTACTPKDSHGVTKNLSPDELQALAEYVFSY